MAINNSKLLSGRVPVTPYSNLTNDRYQFLGLDQAEPSLGAGADNSVLTISTSNNRVWSNALNLSSLTVNGVSNLGNVGNVNITGGSNGQVITTDGSGNLTFTTISVSSNLAAPMPYFIPTGESYTVSNNFQGLFSIPITIDGDLEVNGVLIEVDGSGGNGGGSNTVPGGSNTQIQYNDTGVFGGNSLFTFNEITGVVATPNLTIDGEVSLTGNIIPTANVIYNLGNNTNRFNDLYLSGTTINLGNATLSANSTAVIITNPSGGSFVMGGNANASTSVLSNGNSNITIANNSSIGITANGVSNVVLITKNGLDITGAIGSTGDITTLGNMSALGNFSVVDIAASGNLNVTGDVSMGNANITGSFAASGNLSGVNINTSGDLGVLGNANTSGNLSVLGNANIETNLNVSANLNVGANLIVNTRLTVGNPNTESKSDFYSNGYGFLSNLDVTRNVSANNISISSNLNVSGNITGTGASANFSGDLLVSGSANFNGDLLVSGSANLGNLAIANFFQGDGRYLTNITVSAGTTIVNGNSNVFIEPNANVIFSVNGSPNLVTVTDTNTYFSTNIVSNSNIFTTNIKNENVSILLDGSTNGIGFNTGAGNVLVISDNNIEVTGNTILGNLSASFANISDANVGNITAGNINGGNLVTANFFQGDGYLISNLTIVAGSAITNGNSNVQIAPNANVTITAEGNANVVTVTGNSVILTTELIGNTANFSTANIDTLNANSIIIANVESNIVNAKNLVITADIANGFYGGATLAGNMNVSGNLFVSGYSNVGQINASGIQVSGSITANNTVSANTVSAGIISASGNLSVSGIATLNNTTNVNANLNVSSNVSAGNLNVSSNVSAGNINGGNLVSANFFSGDGYLISNLTVTGGTSLVNGTSNLFVDGSGNVRTSVAGTANVWVVTSTGANLTGAISVSGNANIGNISAGAGLFTGPVTGASANFSGDLLVSGNANILGNIIGDISTTGNLSGGNLISAGVVSATGNVTGANANFNGKLIVSGNANIGNIGAGVGLFTGNVTGASANFSGDLLVSTYANIDGNINIGENANIGGDANIGGNANIGGDANIGGNINGNGSISANGNIIGLNANFGNLVNANFFSGDGYLLTNLTLPTGTSIINGSSNVVVTANSNVNITVNGTPNVLQVAEYGIIINGNVRSTGEIVGASFANGSSNIAITSNGAVDISSNGVDALLSITSTGVFANTRITGLQGLSITGNSNIANLGLTGFITTPGQISAGNLTSSGELTVAANANLANARIAGTLTSIGNITAGNISTAGTANVATLYVGVNGANINGYTKISANLDITGNLNVTGNVNYSNVTDLVIGDPLVFIGANNSGDIVDLGIVATYVTSNTFHTGLARNHTDGYWTFFDGVQTAPNTVINWANATYPTVKLGNLVTTGNATFAGNVSANYFNGNVVGNISGNITVGSNTQVLFSDAGTIAGNNGFTFDKTTGATTVTGNIIGGNLTTGGVVSATGNVSGGNLTTGGALSVTGNANVGNIGATAGVFTTVVGTLTTAAQPNITSVGTLTSLVVTGNISGGNISTAGLISGNAAGASDLVFGNITTLSTAGITTDELYLQATTRLVVTAPDSSGYLFDQYGAGINPTLYARSGDTLAFNLSVSGHPFLIRLSGANYSTGLNHVTTSGVVLQGAAAQGQVAGTLYWKIPYGITGNYQYQCSVHGGMLGTIAIADGNSSNISVTSAGTVTTNAQPNITSVGTLSALSITGNLSVGNVYANSGTISASLLTGTLTTNAQPNITSVGTLSALSITGNLSVGGKSNLGPAGNVIITGGTANYVLSTDGAGNLSWVEQSGGGGGGPASITLDSFTGNGVQTAFVLSTAPQSENYTFVNIDGVDHVKTAYSVAGSTLTFSGAPSNGANIEVTTVSALSNAQPSFTTRTYTGNGVQNTFTVTSGVTSTGILVTENGILQTPDSDYTVSGANLTFTTAPANLQAIQIRELGTVVAASANTAGVSSARALGYSLIFGG